MRTARSASGFGTVEQHVVPGPDALSEVRKMSREDIPVSPRTNGGLLVKEELLFVLQIADRGVEESVQQPQMLVTDRRSFVLLDSPLLCARGPRPVAVSIAPSRRAGLSPQRGKRPSPLLVQVV
jgi:hypothetical protein